MSQIKVDEGSYVIPRPISLRETVTTSWLVIATVLFASFLALYHFGPVYVPVYWLELAQQFSVITGSVITLMAAAYRVFFLVKVAEQQNAQLKRAEANFDRARAASAEHKKRAQELEACVGRGSAQVREMYALMHTTANRLRVIVNGLQIVKGEPIGHPKDRLTAELKHVEARKAGADAMCKAVATAIVRLREVTGQRPVRLHADWSNAPSLADGLMLDTDRFVDSYNFMKGRVAELKDDYDKTRDQLVAALRAHCDIVNLAHQRADLPPDALGVDITGIEQAIENMKSGVNNRLSHMRSRSANSVVAALCACPSLLGTFRDDLTKPGFRRTVMKAGEPFDGEAPQFSEFRALRRIIRAKNQGKVES